MNSTEKIKKPQNQQIPLILFGIKHSGKTTVGKKLADIMDIPFVDIDREIEKIKGMSVRQFYEKFGKEKFYQAETEAAHNIAQEYSNCFVLAAGGGICDNPDALRELEKLNGYKVFLDVSEDVCFSRILESAKTTGTMPAYISERKPKSQEEQQSIFHEFYVRRREAYLKLADKILEFEE